VIILNGLHCIILLVGAIKIKYENFEIEKQSGELKDTLTREKWLKWEKWLKSGELKTNL